VVYFLHGDALGSASLVTGLTGTVVSSLRYTPYGLPRGETGRLPTPYRYTGQRETGVGFYDYQARLYDPAVGRFVSADSIVPEPANPQTLNRYAYTLNNPLKYIDPSGHDMMIVGGVGGDLHAGRWKDWIMAYKGWDEQQWGEFYEGYSGLVKSGDFSGQQALLNSIGVRIFAWGGNSMEEGAANAASEWTGEMVDQLASEMKGMQDITLIGHSKGGNLVMQYLKRLEAGKLAADAPRPLHVALIAPATLPGGFVRHVSPINHSVPKDGPQTINICATGDPVCLSPFGVRNALNVNPPRSHGHNGYPYPGRFAHGLYAVSVLSALNVQGDHQAYDTYRYQ
jgi:RHS repeat-associated protein